MSTEYSLYGLPSEHSIALSSERRFDNYYSVSREVECLLQRLDRELPEGFLARLWSINRAVSIFRYARYVGSIDIDFVEDAGIVAALDKAHRLVASWESENANG